MKKKNYCICKVKKGVLFREQDCFARFVHNGKKTVEIDSSEQLQCREKILVI